MKYQNASPNFSTGTNLQPHHFHQLHRNADFESRFQSTYKPYEWGVLSLNIDRTYLREGHSEIRINEAIIRLKDGTWLHIPENACVTAESFDAENLEYALPIWIGVRKFDSSYPSVICIEDNKKNERRYIEKEISISDENTGDNEKTIRVRLYKVNVFFEPPPQDYEAMKIAEIVRSPHTNQLEINALFSPPLLSFGKNAHMMERLSHCISRMKNQESYLKSNLKSIERKGWNTQQSAKATIQLLRLQTISASVNVLSQFRNNKQHHPYHVYLELVRSIGALSSLIPSITTDIPDYEHEHPIETMDQLFDDMDVLLEDTIEEPEYIPRNFKLVDNVYSCTFDRLWLDSNYDIYLKVKSNKDLEEMDKLFSDYRVTIAPQSKMKDLLAQRKKGFECERVRHSPSGLQLDDNDFFYHINISKKNALWKMLYEDRILAIHGIPSDEYLSMQLCVHVKDKG